MSVTARRSTMGQNVCWPEKTEPRERTRKAMQEEALVKESRRGRALPTM